MRLIITEKGYICKGRSYTETREYKGQICEAIHHDNSGLSGYKSNSRSRHIVELIFK